MPADVSQLPDGVFSDGERLWRAKAGATSSFDDNVAARALFIDLHRDQFWNPWRMEEEAAALERAEQIMEEWERAELGFKHKTARQLDAQMARWDREWERDTTKREKARQANLKRYDQARVEARLALLEHQCVLGHLTDEADQLRTGESYPAMDPTRRAAKLAELDESITQRGNAIEPLLPLVGDPEDVPNGHGKLPRDRRPSRLYEYRERRIAEVTHLREKVTNLTQQMKAIDDKVERSKVRAGRDIAKWRLDKLLSVPRLKAEAMCADCATPASHHGYVSPPYESPCPAWLDWGKRLTEVRRMFDEMVAHNEQKKIAPPPPKPQPLAVLPSGLPIAEVVQRLQDLQQQHPNAEVRRGRANRWELWPANDIENTPR